MSQGYEWYGGKDGGTRRVKTWVWDFWGIYMIVNLLAILALIATIVWAFFDIHERIPYVLLAQIPPIVLMAIRRAFK